MIVTRWDRKTRRPVKVDLGAINPDGTLGSAPITLPLSSLIRSGRDWEPGWDRKLSAPDARLIMAAINGGWVTDDIGHAIAAAMRQLLKSDNPRDRVNAAAVLARLASVDVSRERNDTTERGQDLAAMTATLTALQRSDPEFYSQLCRKLAQIQEMQP